MQYQSVLFLLYFTYGTTYASSTDIANMNTAGQTSRSAGRSNYLLVFLLMVIVFYISLTNYSRTWYGVFNYQTQAAENAQLFLSNNTAMTCVNRQEYVLDICTKNGWKQNRSRVMYSRLLVDEVHKVIYCSISKVGSRTFKKLLVANNGNLQSVSVKLIHNFVQMEENDIKTLERYTDLERMTRLATYKKFIVVRHPFDRLLSAFNNKFTPNLLMHFPKNLTKVILETYPDVPTNTEGIPLLTFPQFLTLIDRGYNNRFWDTHWASYYDVCHPCFIHYDKIIKLETVDDEIGAVYSWIDYQSDELRRDHALRAADLTERFSEVSDALALVDPGVVRGVMDVYRKDFELFGYEWTEKEGVRCTKLSEDGKCC